MSSCGRRERGTPGGYPPGVVSTLEVLVRNVLTDTRCGLTGKLLVLWVLGVVFDFLESEVSVC